MKKVFCTMVGSHMWGMQHKGSDIDQFVCYLTPTEKILDGTAELKSFVEKENGNDVAYHEASKVVEQLLTGNVNFLWGVMSPIAVVTGNWHEWLKGIVRENVAKNCYHSIHGLATHNYKKYIESGKDASEKRCNTIGRTINLGLVILTMGEFKFVAVTRTTPDDIVKGIEALDEAYKASKLPEEPNPIPFREWLFRLRLLDLSDLPYLREGW